MRLKTISWSFKKSCMFFVFLLNEGVLGYSLCRNLPVFELNVNSIRAKCCISAESIVSCVSALVLRVSLVVPVAWVLSFVTCVNADNFAGCISAESVASCVSAENVASYVSAESFASCVSAENFASCVSAESFVSCINAEFCLLG